jgi:hypothetical protein
MVSLKSPSHTLLWFSNLTQYAAIVAAFAPKPNHKLNLVHTFVQSSGIYQRFPIGSVQSPSHANP